MFVCTHTCKHIQHHRTRHTPSSGPSRAEIGTDEVKRLVADRRIVFYRQDRKFADRAHWIFWSPPDGRALRAVLTTDFQHIVTVMTYDDEAVAVEPLVPLARRLAENPVGDADMSELNGETTVPVRLVVHPKRSRSPSVLSARVSVTHLVSDDVLRDRAFLRDVARAHPTLLPALLHQAVFLTREEGGGTISSPASVAGETLLRERR